ncbi:class I SAM-dependent methyltransferase [Corynebacterium caspium]|uniref:class I SAM-dependent methyltransferase n=1 Tax=Corynebacterium caspium TaxID=234828 RepID=UPI00036F819C|nr:class I SAM-dependent methyltransferase [Corynebacterium caspium]WKD59614.1 Ubiquinone biosynthesis O-methyltransferase [Corynebacterium caspium DSM 44850]
MSKAEIWEERYAASPQLWSDTPNAFLPELASSWAPAKALDIGCGEGADALWLAENGWQITGIDYSPTAIKRFLAKSAARGLTKFTRGYAGDAKQLLGLTTTKPAPLHGEKFDLITIFYVHTPDLPQLITQVSAHLNPGGRIFIATHAFALAKHPPEFIPWPAASLLAEINPTRNYVVELNQRRENKPGQIDDLLILIF